MEISNVNILKASMFNFYYNIMRSLLGRDSLNSEHRWTLSLEILRPVGD